MRYKPGYKELKRKELLQISGALAKRQGFANTGVDGFMKAANMTSGAFYSHFSSKQALFKALIESEISSSIQQWENNPHQHPKAWLEFEIQRYLSFMHVQNIDKGCVLPALAAEIGRADEEIKLCFENELVHGHQIIAQHIQNPELAWGVLSQLVGGVLLARSVTDPTLQRNILDSSKTLLFTMLDSYSKN